MTKNSKTPKLDLVRCILEYQHSIYTVDEVRFIDELLDNEYLEIEHQSHEGIKKIESQNLEEMIPDPKDESTERFLYLNFLFESPSTSLVFHYQRNCGYKYSLARNNSKSKIDALSLLLGKDKGYKADRIRLIGSILDPEKIKIDGHEHSFSSAQSNLKVLIPDEGTKHICIEYILGTKSLKFNYIPEIGYRQI
ncbi:MAG: hypothetical protein KKF44_06080 [Nanoarchaeota archaeon]|nr:hypothetical protein [Nanoarchaeota archaeon]